MPAGRAGREASRKQQIHSEDRLKAQASGACGLWGGRAGNRRINWFFIRTIKLTCRYPSSHTTQPGSQPPPQPQQRTEGHSLRWPQDVLTQLSARLTMLAVPHTDVKRISENLHTKWQGPCLAPGIWPRSILSSQKTGGGEEFYPGKLVSLKKKPYSIILTLEFSQEIARPLPDHSAWNPADSFFLHRNRAFNQQLGTLLKQSELQRIIRLLKGKVRNQSKAKRNLKET